MGMRFEDCVMLGDAGIVALADALDDVPVERLELIFDYCDKISDNGVQELAENLPLSLTHVILNFRRCVKLTDRCVTHLAESLENKLDLKSITLDFVGTGVTPDAHKTFMDKLAS